MDTKHILPKDDGFAHIVDDFDEMGCPCDPNDGTYADETGVVKRAVLHRRMDGGADRVEAVWSPGELEGRG